jgi:thiamine-phosphate pyrophosphorylase
VSAARTALPRLHVVTDDDVVESHGFLERARAAIEAGGARLALHLRHRTDDARLYGLAETLGQVAAAAGATFLVNRRADIAHAAGAAGVHLGRGAISAHAARAVLGPEAWIGVSIHRAEEAPQARGPADYAVFGPVFATDKHPGERPAGPRELERTARRTRLPVLAIGGVRADRVAACLRAGAHGVAVVSAVWAAADPRRAVEVLLRRTEEASA